MSLPDAVRREIDEIVQLIESGLRGGDMNRPFLLLHPGIERIALLAYRSGIEAGVQAGLEAAAEQPRDFDDREAIRSLDPQHIAENAVEEK